MSIQFTLDFTQFTDRCADDEQYTDKVSVLFVYYKELIEQLSSGRNATIKETEDKEELLDIIYNYANDASDAEDDQKFDEFFKLTIQLYIDLENNQYIKEKASPILQYLNFLISKEEEPSVRNNFIKQYQEYITSHQLFNASKKINLLGELFNVLGNFSKDQQQCFDFILDYVQKQGKTSMIKQSIDNIDHIVSKWGISQSEVRKIYAKIIKNSESNMLLEEQNRNLQLKYINSFQDQKINDEEYKLIKQYLLNLLNQDDLLLLSSKIMRSNALQFLASKKDKLSDIIQFFISGNYKEYKSFTTKNASILKELNINQEELDNRMKIKSIPQIVETGDIIKLDEFAKRLEVPVEESEQWIILAIQYNLLEASIDQYNQTIQILSNDNKYFDKKEWQNLDAQLQQTIEKLTNILSKLD